MRPEEDDVGGLKVREVDQLGVRHLAAHDVRRPAAERRGEIAFPRIARELVHAPYESRAVVSAAGRHAEVHLVAVARAAPHVRHSDVRDRGVDDPPLPRRVLRERERVGQALHDRHEPAGRVHELRRRVRGLGACGRVVGQQLERPSSRATTSLPNRSGIASPAARAPRANSFAAASRPIPSTSCASSVVIVAAAAPCATFGGCVGGAGAGAATVVVVAGTVVVSVGSVAAGSTAVVVVGLVVCVGSVVVVTGGAGAGGAGGARSRCRSKTRFASA